MSYAASENPPVPFHAIDAGLVGKMHAELRTLLEKVRNLENEVEIKDKIIQHLNGDAIVIDLE